MFSAQNEFEQERKVAMRRERTKADEDEGGLNKKSRLELGFLVSFKYSGCHHHNLMKNWRM